MSRFQRIYPPRNRIHFDGGKNNKFERSIIADNESPDCANVVFTNGAVETRDGFAKVNTTSVGSFACDGIYTRNADDGSETMCAFYGGNMYTLGTTTMVTVPSAQSVFTVGVRVAAAQYENRLFIGNGGVIPYKYDGTNFTRHGVYPPTTTSTVASQNTGPLTGDYRYKVTWVNSQLVEGDVGPVTTTFTAASATLRLTSLPVAPQSYGVSYRRIYRTEAGGTTFKRVAEVADNSTTTYDDSTADAGLGTAAPTDKGVPPKYSVIVYHQNRLFMNDPENPNFVWYTDLAEPYTVASTNFIRVGDAASDLVRGLSVYDNSLVIYCDRSEWIVYMTDSDPANWSAPIRISSGYGSKSPFCLLDIGGRQLFPAMENDKFVGFAALEGNTVSPSATLLTVASAGSDLISDRVEPDMFQIQEAYVGNISGMVFKNKAWISVTYGSGATQNNRIYHVDFSISNLSRNQKESWVPFTGLSAAQFTIYDGNLYFGSSTANGFVYKLNPGVYNDDGAAINSYYWTKEFSGIDSEVNMQKDFRYANILVEKSGDYMMTVHRRVDSDRGEGATQQIDLYPGGSIWGTMMWGRDNWGGGTDQSEVRLYLNGARGKRIQFKFTNQNTANQKFKVHGMNFHYIVKGLR